MDTKKTINLLWIELRQRINQAYAVADKTRNEDGVCLRDYAENISWSDNLASLLGREAANERQHRAHRPSVSGFSVETAAKLLLMENIRFGATKEAMPSATAFLVFRQTAAEAQVIGFLIREFLDQEWRQAVVTLDYSKLMKGKPDAQCGPGIGI
jgi:hypothetical protein